MGNAEWAHTTMPAKEMPLIFGTELIFAQIRFTRQQAKKFWFHHCCPAAYLQTKTAVAAHGAVCQIDVRFKTYGFAMATAVIGFHDVLVV